MMTSRYMSLVFESCSGSLSWSSPVWSFMCMKASAHRESLGALSRLTPSSRYILYSYSENKDSNINSIRIKNDTYIVLAKVNMNSDGIHFAVLLAVRDTLTQRYLRNDSSCLPVNQRFGTRRRYLGAATYLRAQTLVWYTGYAWDHCWCSYPSR